METGRINARTCELTMLHLVNVADFAVLPAKVGLNYAGRVVTWMPRSFITLFFQLSMTVRPPSTSSIRRPVFASMLFSGLGSVILSASTSASSWLRPPNDPQASSHSSAQPSLFGRCLAPPPHLPSKSHHLPAHYSHLPGNYILKSQQPLLRPSSKRGKRTNGQ
ncbi:hypothetical protein HOY80DRAFT_347420 [Tuber brumale]|nr:hypothetical protein HOY80DRAFT_347420 [Tuber brumale]